MKHSTLRHLTLRGLAAAAILAAIAAAFVSGGAGLTAAAKEKDVTYAPIATGAYNFDPAHGIIGFAVRHLEINWVEGRFKDFTGTVNYNAEDITKSTVSFSAKIDSVDTGVEQRNNHLKTADFFDAATYPEMKFVSTKVEKKGKNFILAGDLTIKNVTKHIEFPFTVTGGVKDPWGNSRFGIEAHTKINRRDFGVNYGNPFAGGIDVGNEITINLQLEAFKPEPKAN